ncbi:PadR family transcriptional regulator [Paenibacillus sp. LMG 31459]|uniref:PadR family transcriptional regulator n=1 Tax=Paenibacillus phytohabitans TaxID=2654978 RepID=A0ABX1YS92_9BACL|nr:PadR family transcriptional regulator [Paenibacillus phytohabitans]NOU83797.1 PadR family transcriptional regulator [Paenibacillus phytohabitans]
MAANRSKTGYVLLGLLNEENLTGYEIKKIVDTRLSFFWSESFGQIYPELKRLAAGGLIAVCEEPVSVEGKNSKQSIKYQITASGRYELQEWLKTPVEKETVRYELLLKLYFSNSSSSATMLEHVREFEINHRRQQQLFGKFEAQLKQNLDVHSNHSRILMVLSFGQKLWESYADWCGQTIALLEQEIAEQENPPNE